MAARSADASVAVPSRAAARANGGSCAVPHISRARLGRNMIDAAVLFVGSRPGIQPRRAVRRERCSAEIAALRRRSPRVAKRRRRAASAGVLSSLAAFSVLTSRGERYHLADGIALISARGFGSPGPMCHSRW